MYAELGLQRKVTSAFHPQEQEHGDDGQEGADGVRDDELQRVVVGNEEDVEHRRCRKVSGQEAAGVRQHGSGLDDRQAEEGDGPDAVENLKEFQIGDLLGVFYFEGS